MKQGQFQIRLRPLCGGAFTRVQLCGCVPTAIPPQLVRRLAKLLSFWSGWPVVLALSVESETGGWCELWTESVKDIPERHLDLRFSPARRIGVQHEP